MTNGALQIAVVNMKGGVCKTTTAIHVAAGLARSGAQVLLVDGQPDYAHMWGIGIGVSLADPGSGQPAGTYDADAHQVVGLSFEIDNVPPGLRVELPTPSDPPPFGASYWGADEYYSSSPVQVGTNVVFFEDVHSPDPTAPALDTTQLLQVGFLVSSNEVRRTDFSYCCAASTRGANHAHRVRKNLRLVRFNRVASDRIHR